MEEKNLVLVVVAVVAVLFLSGSLGGSYSGALGTDVRRSYPDQPGSVYPYQSQGEGAYAYATYTGNVRSAVLGTEGNCKVACKKSHDSCKNYYPQQDCITALKACNNGCIR